MWFLPSSPTWNLHRSFFKQGRSLWNGFLPMACTFLLFLCLRLSKHIPVTLLSRSSPLERREDWQTRSLILAYSLRPQNSAGNMRTRSAQLPIFWPIPKVILRESLDHWGYNHAAAHLLSLQWLSGFSGDHLFSFNKCSGVLTDQRR